MDMDEQVAGYFAGIWPHLNERTRRLIAASKAVELGRGGISRVSEICGLSRNTVAKGIEELQGTPLAPDRIRGKGGGRRALACKDRDLVEVLDTLLEPTERGDPESPLRWTVKSTRTLAGELVARRHPISHSTIARMLQKSGYSLQSNRKTKEGEDDHPDRDGQFRNINRAIRRALRDGDPVISVDTKKKELIGNYKNSGRQWRKVKTAPKVQGHDFPSPEIPRAFPYGIYDLGRNTGFVNVGTDHDTGAFAVASIRGWWRAEARRLYPDTRHLLVTADGGGSNGWRLRLWKWELQRLANETGLTIDVHHFPPGTSKWNKVEHRLFSFISSNWRDEPLRDYETVIRLIAATTTAKGLTVSCRLDRRRYPTGRKISNDEYAKLALTPHKFHGEWNYTIQPCTFA